MTDTTTYHIPVLLHESVDGLDIKPDGIYVDVTFGGGGHSREILSRLGPEGHLYSFDQDADAEQNILSTSAEETIEKTAEEAAEGTTEQNILSTSAEEATEGTIEKTAEVNGKGEATASSNVKRFVDDPRFTFVRSNFRYLKNWMRYYGVDRIDGLLADLGVSSHHFDDETRGFSFRFDAPLDMRMNKRAGQTAADIVNNYTEERLADIFYLYGELKNSRRLASLIVKSRSERTIVTTGDLVAVIEKALPRERVKKEMAKVFQALRIEVNHEMEALCEMLSAAVELLGNGGRLSVITYHSLEDRITKNIMRSGNAEGKVEQDFFGQIKTPLKTMGNKVTVATDEEQTRNPRSRSAKLRVAVKTKQQN